MRRVQYAKVGDSHVAFQVIGSGAVDLVFACEWWNHLEEQWNHPPIANFLDALASFSRLVLFDKRGTGLSDPLPAAQPPTLENWIDDVRAVMDAARSERACILGQGGGAPMAAVFAAFHPDRADRLVLSNAWCRLTQAPDFPYGWPAEAVEPILTQLVGTWGRGDVLDHAAPSVAGNRAIRDWWGRFHRLSCSPGVAASMWRFLMEVDIREILPLIRIPTLVLHRRGDRTVPCVQGEYIAGRIPGARLQLLPGEDHYFWAGDTRPLLAEIQEFATGQRGITSADSALLTVLFTDIVRSTETARSLGDHRWKELLDRHDQLVRRELRRFGGREVETTGDGFLAVFDRPSQSVRCAAAIRDSIQENLGLSVRTGLHAGECEVRGSGVAGIAVHAAARVLAQAEPGEVTVSRTLRDLLAGSGIRFAERGEHSLKGIDGTWQLYAVEAV